MDATFVLSKTYFMQLFDSVNIYYDGIKLSVCEIRDVFCSRALKWYYD